MATGSRLDDVVPFDFDDNQRNIGSVPWPAYMKGAADGGGGAQPKVYAVTVPIESLLTVALGFAHVPLAPTGTSPQQFILTIRTLHFLLSLLQRPGLCNPLSDTKKRGRDGNSEPVESNAPLFWKMYDEVMEDDSTKKRKEKCRRFQVLLEKVVGRDADSSVTRAWRVFIIVYDENMDLTHGVLQHIDTVKNMHPAQKQEGKKTLPAYSVAYNMDSWNKWIDLVLQYNPGLRMEDLMMEEYTSDQTPPHPASIDSIFALEYSIEKAGRPHVYDASQTTYANYKGVDGISVLRFPHPQHVYALSYEQSLPSAFFHGAFPDTPTASSLTTPVSSYLSASQKRREMLNAMNRLSNSELYARGRAVETAQPTHNYTCFDRLKENNERRIKEQRKSKDKMWQGFYGNLGMWAEFGQAMEEGGCKSVRAAMRFYMDAREKATSIGKQNISMVAKDSVVYDPEIRPLGNFLAHFMMMCETGFYVKMAHIDVLFGYLAAQSAWSWLPGLRLNCLKFGPAKAGKSFIDECVQKCLLPDTWLPVAESTEKALSTGADYDRMRLHYDEAPTSFTGVKQNNTADGSGSALIKMLLSSGQQNNMMAYVKDGKRETIFTNSRARVQCSGNTNLGTDAGHEAMQSRWIVSHCVEQDRPQFDITAIETAMRMNSDSERNSEHLQKFIQFTRKVDWGVCCISQAIDTGNLPEPRLGPAVLAYQHMVGYLNDMGLRVKEDPRELKKYTMLCSILCCIKAFLHVFCTEMVFKEDEPFQWSQFSKCAPHLVADHEIAAVAFTFLHREKVDTTSASIMQAFVQHKLRDVSYAPTTTPTKEKEQQPSGSSSGATVSATVSATGSSSGATSSSSVSSTTSTRSGAASTSSSSGLKDIPLSKLKWRKNENTGLNDMLYLEFFINKVERGQMADHCAYEIRLSLQNSEEIRDTSIEGVHSTLRKLQAQTYVTKPWRMKSEAGKEEYEKVASEPATAHKIVVIDAAASKIYILYDWLVWTMTDTYKDLLLNAVRQISYSSLPPQKVVTACTFANDKSSCCPHLLKVVELKPKAGREWIYLPTRTHEQLIEQVARMKRGEQVFLGNEQPRRVCGDMDLLSIGEITNLTGYFDEETVNKDHYSFMPTYDMCVAAQANVDKAGDYPTEYAKVHKKFLEVEEGASQELTTDPVLQEIIAKARSKINKGPSQHLRHTVEQAGDDDSEEEEEEEEDSVTD
jgi:hypothetical protein